MDEIDETRLDVIIETLASMKKTGDCRMYQKDTQERTLLLPFKADSLLRAMMELKSRRAEQRIPFYAGGVIGSAGPSRDELAMSAMNGLLSCGAGNSDERAVSEAAYRVADAMIKAGS